MLLRFLPLVTPALAMCLRVVFAWVLALAPVAGAALSQNSPGKQDRTLSQGAMPAAAQGSTRADAPHPWLPPCLVEPWRAHTTEARSSTHHASPSRERPAHVRRTVRRLHFSGSGSAEEDATPGSTSQRD